MALSLTLPRSLSLRARRRWFGIAILAVLWHLVLLTVPWDRILPEPHLLLPPPRVDLRDVSKEELAKIRNQWKQKKFLLGQDSKVPEDAKRPENARFESDRNRRVERETQARSQEILPSPGAQSPTRDRERKRTAQERSDPRTRPEARPRVDLRNLGVPMFAARPAAELASEAEPMARDPSESARAADQSILEKELPYGAENMLNTEQNIYYSFYARLYQSIAPIWQSKIREVPQSRSVPPGDYLAAADVVFDEKGNLIDVRILQSSGIPEFDQAIHDSWKSVGRFPNPPRDLLNARGEVHTGWSFSVQVDSSFNWHSGGPRRY